MHRSVPIFSCCEHNLAAHITPALLSVGPQSWSRNLLRRKIALWRLWFLNVSEPGMISTSQADLPWGHRAQSCFNYPGFLLSHCHCKAPMPCWCAVLSPHLPSPPLPCRGGDDNSDNFSSRSTDPTRVPSEICEAESIPLSLWSSLCLLLFALCYSFFFLCHKVFMAEKKATGCMKELWEWELNRFSPVSPVALGPFTSHYWNIREWKSSGVRVEVPIETSMLWMQKYDGIVTSSFLIQQRAS